ncbi:MAG: MBL fold metallo-hydrolase [Firmicutes bacterium]|nr:MBL fold metallo-hydrolase [Bacillota bacterium]
MKLKSWTTKNRVEVIRVLEGRCNSYLVRQGDRALLVDTGRKNAWKHLSRNLDRMGLEAGGLCALILTHTHFDHAENAAAVKERYQARVVVHRSEGEFLRAGDSPLPRGTVFPTRAMMALAAKRVQPLFRYRPVNHDILVEEEYDLNPWGFNAGIIHTPGHTAGSISVIVDDEIAIAGDTLVGMLPGSVFSPFADDAGLMVESWQKLLQTGCRVFLPAHGRPVSRELLQSQYEKRTRG